MSVQFSSPTSSRDYQTQLSLDGAWQCEGHHPAGHPVVAFAAIIPGHIHVDLMREKLLPDLFWRDNASSCLWVEEMDWTFQRTFEVPEEMDLDWIELTFAGIDTFSTIYLNGIEIGSTSNMFIGHSWEVGKILHHGRNKIVVKIHAHRDMIADKPLGKYFSCFSTDRVYTRRMQCTYGWDWVHRFLSTGIWRPVTLTSYNSGRLLDVMVRTLECSDEHARLELEIETECLRGHATNVHLEMLGPEGDIVWQKAIAGNVSNGNGSSRHRHQITIQAEIDQPLLWWPNGEGNQPLYSLRATLEAAGGSIQDTREVEFGIRTIEIERNPLPTGETFAFVVNGRRLFAKGGNWVPADPFPSRIEEKHYAHLIELARESGANMLRAWGGGIYEPEAFWRACNRAGILIMQDFLLACADYPEDDPEFLVALKREFETAIRQLRNHPSLAMWSGTNELGMNALADEPYNGKLISETISAPLCARLDPTRPYIPTSPFTPVNFAHGPEGGRTHNWLHAGDSHNGVLYQKDFILSNMKDYRRRFTALSSSFLSESAVYGAPPWHSLMKFLDESDLQLSESRLLEFRTKDNPHGDLPLTLFEGLQLTAKNLYGEFRDARDRIRKMEYVAWEGSRLTLESLRTKRDVCSGVLFWMFNDCWPASGWSQVDHYGIPKAGYYGFKAGARPVIGTLQQPTEDVVQVWVCSDLPHAVNAHIKLWGLKIGHSHQQLLHSNISLPAQSSQLVSTNNSKWSDYDLLILDTIANDQQDRCVFSWKLPGELNFRPTNLHLQASNPHEGIGAIRISSTDYARVVSFEGDALFEDNYFDLLPGEERLISWRSLDGTNDPLIEVRCWNQANEY